MLETNKHFKMKFGYNARCHWLIERALSEYKAKSWAKAVTPSEVNLRSYIDRASSEQLRAFCDILSDALSGRPHQTQQSSCSGEFGRCSFIKHSMSFVNFSGMTFLTALVLFNHSDYFNYSNKYSDWLIVTCLMRVQSMVTTLLFALQINTSACVHRDMNHAGRLESKKDT